jgi:hypothetical protein
VYFSVATANSVHAARILSVLMMAHLSARSIVVEYDPNDTSGTAFGCQAHDCRRLPRQRVYWDAPRESARPRRLALLHLRLSLFIAVSGLITPWFGVRRLHRFLNWWSERSPGFRRAWASLALVFGLVLAYAVIP